MMSVSGWMFLLVPAHLGCPGQNPKSRKTVVYCVCVPKFKEQNYPTKSDSSKLMKHVIIYHVLIQCALALHF